MRTVSSSTDSRRKTHLYCYRFGLVAIKLRYITRYQLAHALRQQRADYHSARRYRLIGAVLLDLGLLSAKQVLCVLDQQAQDTEIPSHRGDNKPRSLHEIVKSLTKLDKTYGFLLRLKPGYCQKLDLLRWANEVGINIFDRKDNKAVMLVKLQKAIRDMIKIEQAQTQELVILCRG
jgi:hypothetical protein